MTRREAIQNLTILGISLSIPTSIANLSQRQKPLKIIGIGNMGCETVCFFHEQHVSAEYIYYDSLCSTNANTWLDAEISEIDEIPYFLNGQIPQNKVRSFFNKNNRYFIAINPADKMTTKIGLSILKYFNDNNHDYSAVVYIPFSWEGKLKRVIAYSFFNLIRDLDKLIVVDMNDMCIKYGHYKVNDAYDAIYNDVLKQYLCISKLNFI